ncbi:trans-resveratrol di-O-methyltransferase-like [Gossypium australe]|uniref:Trans-resveratrol di-O-methyltransferase-like n=1 Tax=Gossypium australe TaxID=47621 RepID=A0A5B6WLH8_9ROSI|nr:trans-resveratrol di-O-methyltransferase-like [Gossypium australe]
MLRKKNEEEMFRNLNINVIFEEGIGEENLSGICPYIPGSVLNNWTAEEIPSNVQNTVVALSLGAIRILFCKRHMSNIFISIKSPDINDTSDTAADLKSPFEQDMCPEKPQDFENYRDCILSPDLLRKVEQDEKQILHYKDLVEIVNLGDKQEKKEENIRACITTETKRDLIELLQEFKDVFV